MSVKCPKYQDVYSFESLTKNGHCSCVSSGIQPPPDYIRDLANRLNFHEMDGVLILYFS